MADCANIDLEDILAKIDSGKIQLPEFQRDWTWDDNRICGILSSLIENYPIGSVMCLTCGGDSSDFEYRMLEGVTMTRKVVPETVILDGQQRLTSIYRAIFSKAPVETKDDKGKKILRYYYLDINACLDKKADRFDAVLSVAADGAGKQFKRVAGSVTETIDLSTHEMEYEHEFFPLNVVFDTKELNKWMRGYLTHYGYEEIYEEKYDLFVDEVLKYVSDYKLPVITLDRNTPREAICKVFENVNTGGVELTVFDLMTAKFSRKRFNLRNDWKDCKEIIQQPKSKFHTDLFYEVSETDFLTAVTLYTNYIDSGMTTTSCKRKDILDLSVDSYKKNKKIVLSGYNLAEEFLLDQCVFTKRDLPYNAQITPLAVMCAVLGETDFNKPEVQRALSKWFWCGVLGEMYGSSTDTRSAIDIEDVLKDIRGETSFNRTVNAASFSSTRLLSLQSRQSAAYKGILALIYKENALDFMHGTSMNITRFILDSPDIHHIFPKAYCKKLGYDESKWNSIVNKTPLIPVSNKQIGKAAPSDYSKKIMKGAGIKEDELRKRVESNLIDYDLFIADKFNEYFIDRAKKLIGLIEKAMGKDVTDKDAADTISQFGASLL